MLSLTYLINPGVHFVLLEGGQMRPTGEFEHGHSFLCFVQIMDSLVMRVAQ